MKGGFPLGMGVIMSESQTEQRQTSDGGSKVLVDGLERVWSEIKEISRQVERETRRSGQIARLRLDIRRLKRETFEVRARLGKAVYEAQRQAGGELRLDQVEGWAARVAAIDDLTAQIAAKEQQIEELRGKGSQSEEPAAEAAR